MLWALPDFQPFMTYLKRIGAALFGLFILFYIASAILLATRSEPLPDFDGTVTGYSTIAIFGASGTAGDGILKAALDDPAIGLGDIFRGAAPFAAVMLVLLALVLAFPILATGLL